jgi:hypothetical protein
MQCILSALLIGESLAKIAKIAGIAADAASPVAR